MKRSLRCFLLCLPVLALPFQGAAAAVMMVGTATQEAGAGVSMASHHAAVLVETRASLSGAHDAGTAPHCHDAAKAAPDGAADAGKAPLPRHGSDHGGCGLRALGAALPAPLMTRALAERQHAAPASAIPADTSITPSLLLRPPAALA